KKKIFGKTRRPRLSVFISLKNIYAQIIDDEKNVTLACASTVDKELKKEKKAGVNIETAKKVGELVAKRALVKGITTIVFDRGSKRYHGRVEALARSVRAAGLKF
ncbi:MAG: 50S ribosomal protein L18, partial [Candidatus Margulisiibacteriota bacterium]